MKGTIGGPANFSSRVLKDGNGSTNKITVMDLPGAEGACHRYLVTKDHMALCFVKFQEGPIKESGVNGCQNEDLLSVVIDRLKCFQDGDLACDENERALRKIEEGLAWLRYRTASRTYNGLEGTYKR